MSVFEVPTIIVTEDERQLVPLEEYSLLLNKADDARAECCYWKSIIADLSNRTATAENRTVAAEKRTRKALTLAYSFAAIAIGLALGMLFIWWVR